MILKLCVTCPRPQHPLQATTQPSRGDSIGILCARAPESNMYSGIRRRVVSCSSDAGDGVVRAEPEQQEQIEVCKTCGVPKNEMAFGCDGSGRIMGGIGAVPGFGWWPIKAYRPCGKAVDAGVTYQRKGQGVDEVMFGRK